MTTRVSVLKDRYNATICTTGKNNRVNCMVYGIIAIDEEDEQNLDSKKTIFKKIDNDFFIKLNLYNCIGYGEINFDCEEDLEILEKINVLNNRDYGIFIPGNFDYDKAKGNTYQYGLQLVETFDIIKAIKYAHCLIGKSKRCAIYKIKATDICKDMKSN